MDKLVSDRINALQTPTTEEFELGDWKFTASFTKSILPSIDPCSATHSAFPNQSCDFCFYNKTLKDLPQLPEMIFPRNRLVIMHRPTLAAIDFNPIEALKLVDAKRDWVKVKCTQEWSDARKHCEFIKNTIKPYDWTYSTAFAGMCSNLKSVHFSIYQLSYCFYCHFYQISPTDEKINLETLKRRDKILFYQEMIFYEDELADHGCSCLSLKFRVMPTCFFALLRFYLRVDKVLVKINDTRLFWENGSKYIIREYSSKQKLVADMSPDQVAKCTDPNEISVCLNLVEEKCEKLFFM